MAVDELAALADEQTAAMKARDGALLAEVARRYAEVWQSLRGDLEELTAQIEGARTAGEQVDQAWLFRQDRLRRLLAQVGAQMAAYGQDIEDVIADGQAAAAEAGQNDAYRLMQRGTGSVGVGFGEVPTRAVERLVGRSVKTGAPLNTALGKLPGEAADKITKGLVRGVVLGLGPAQIARDIRKDLGGNLGKYMTIARTETVGAYRDAGIETYRANQDVVEGWEWVTAGDELVCPFCAGMNGSIHPVDEDFDSHPNCRCSAVPKVRAA
jgi:SPP1 gp7 family putative phage head morphogenesis protein